MRKSTAIIEGITTMADLKDTWEQNAWGIGFWDSSVFNTSRVAEMLFKPILSNEPVSYGKACETARQALGVTQLSQEQIQALQISIFFHHPEGLNGDQDAFDQSSLQDFENFTNSNIFQELIAPKSVNDYWLEHQWNNTGEYVFWDSDNGTSDLAEEIIDGDLTYTQAIQEATAALGVSELSPEQQDALDLSIFFHHPKGLNGDRDKWNELTTFDSFTAFVKTPEFQGLVQPDNAAPVNLSDFNEAANLSQLQEGLTVKRDATAIYTPRPFIEKNFVPSETLDPDNTTEDLIAEEEVKEEVKEKEEKPEEKKEVKEDVVVKAKPAGLPYDDNVMKVQSLLYLNGYKDVGRVDGKLGSNTQASIDKYIADTDGLEKGASVNDILKNLTDRLANDTEFYTKIATQAVSNIEKSDGDYSKDDYDARAAQGFMRIENIKDDAGNLLNVDGDVGPLTKQALAHYKTAKPEIISTITDPNKTDVHEEITTTTNGGDIVLDFNVLRDDLNKTIEENTAIKSDIEALQARLTEAGDLAPAGLKNDIQTLLDEHILISETTATLLENVTAGNLEETQKQLDDLIIIKNQNVELLGNLNTRVEDVFLYEKQADLIKTQYDGLGEETSKKESVEHIKTAFQAATGDEHILNDVNNLSQLKRAFKETHDYHNVKSNGVLKDGYEPKENDIAVTKDNRAVVITHVNDSNQIFYSNDKGDLVHLERHEIKWIGDSEDFIKDQNKPVVGPTISPQM